MKTISVGLHACLAIEDLQSIMKQEMTQVSMQSNSFLPTKSLIKLIFNALVITDPTDFDSLRSTEDVTQFLTALRPNQSLSGSIIVGLYRVNQ